MSHLLAILDFEASGFDGYPIEVGTAAPWSEGRHFGLVLSDRAGGAVVRDNAIVVFGRGGSWNAQINDGKDMHAEKQALLRSCRA
jgi:hypothetical protein